MLFSSSTHRPSNGDSQHRARYFPRELSLPRGTVDRDTDYSAGLWAQSICVRSQMPRQLLGDLKFYDLRIDVMYADGFAVRDRTAFEIQGIEALLRSVFAIGKCLACNGKTLRALDCRRGMKVANDTFNYADIADSYRPH